MSRLAGLWTAAPSRHAALEGMLAVLRHPAWGTVWRHACGHAALGWCGWRPASAAVAGPLVVVLDGYFYDAPRAAGDAAVVLDLYARGGLPRALAQLDGDFALALYDARCDTLWLARDRFGVRPLYYTASPERLAFASQPRALLALPGVSPRVHRHFVALYAASHYRYVDHNPAQSPYVDIAQLPAAHLLCYRQGHVTVTSYWSLQEAPELTTPEEDLAAELRARLLDAVSRRLARTRHPAFTLSGGMDSASVLACAAHLRGHKQAAFSAVYDDPTYDESEGMASTAAAHAAPWYRVAITTPDVPALVAQLVALHDQPVATVTWLAHYLLCQQVRARGFDSLFGGLGGDELNAGEYEYFVFFFADLARQGWHARLQDEVAQWIAHHDHPVYRKSLAVAEEGLRRLVDLSQPGRCLPDLQRLRRYARLLHPDYFRLEDFIPPMPHPFRSYLHNRAYQDLFQETLPCCLRAEERQSTALGLDPFHPFLDRRLVEFLFRVPAHLKIRRGITKHLLRRAMAGLVPEATRQRIKKMGWNAPAHLWFADSARESLLDLVHSQRFRQRGIYNLQEVERLIAEHARIVTAGLPVENHMMVLWQLLNLELWLRWLDARGYARPLGEGV
ncbi:MAG: asparagine synthetase B [Candidatus Tectimicrobiota bacterium]|nr:MAG: asparagine synthetase B [Candidatus Tectomicrobia bacterium]